VNADQFIAARGSSDTKVRLRALAARESLSESWFLKHLVELVLQAADAAGAASTSRADRQAGRTSRLMIRLRADDQLLLRERAAARGMAPVTYVSVLPRAHLRALAPLPKEELLALKRTV